MAIVDSIIKTVDGRGCLDAKTFSLILVGQEFKSRWQINYNELLLIFSH